MDQLEPLPRGNRETVEVMTTACATLRLAAVQRLGPGVVAGAPMIEIAVALTIMVVITTMALAAHLRHHHQEVVLHGSQLPRPLPVPRTMVDMVATRHQVMAPLTLNQPWVLHLD